jgi:formylglycine-generating enzyme required for sulfatase activity
MRFLGSFAFLLAALSCMAQTPVVTSIQGNGEVTWTNAADTAAVYRVEWASSAGGPWRRSSQGLDLIEGRSNTSFSASVPMFYRVVTASNLPPPGLVLVDAGDFTMGQSGLATPVHTNFVSAFYMDRYEVTKAKWDQVRNWGLTNGYADLAAGDAGYPAGQPSNHPVVNVNWYDCVKWCNARSRKEGLPPVYYTSAARTTPYTNGAVDVSSNCVDWAAEGYRLPTEAEWEKAARGGLEGHWFPWPSYGGSYTDHVDGGKANYASSGDPYDNGTTPVGYYDGSQSPRGDDMANSFGLYDMAGNVWEWCWDWSGASYTAAREADPLGPDSGIEHIQRGGSWGNVTADGIRIADRGHNLPNERAIYHGFRCVRRY